MQFKSIDTLTDGSTDTPIDALTDAPSYVLTYTLTVAATATPRDALTDDWQMSDRCPDWCVDRHTDRWLTGTQQIPQQRSWQMPWQADRQLVWATQLILDCNQCHYTEGQHAKKIISELHFNMAMIKDWIELCSSNVWRLQHAVPHAMGYIKLHSVFCLF